MYYCMLKKGDYLETGDKQPGDASISRQKLQLTRNES